MLKCYYEKSGSNFNSLVVDAFSIPKLHPKNPC